MELVKRPQGIVERSTMALCMPELNRARPTPSYFLYVLSPCYLSPRELLRRGK